MPAFSFSLLLQLLIALGLLNVWLLRSGRKTEFRGGEARSLREEFDAYGLPGFMFYVVGALKIGAAALLIAAIWVEALVAPTAAMVALLMVGALAMHIKVQDPPLKSLPAFLMLLMSGALVALALS